jgi:hypothetical protein
MGDRPAKLKLGGAIVAAAVGAVLAAAAATAQGPGDYQPTTSTTTTFPGPGPSPNPDTKVEFKARAKAGALKAYVVVRVNCSESCTAQGRGRVRLSDVPRNGSAPFALKRDRVSTDGGKTKLKLKVPKLAQRIAARRSYDGKVRAKLTVVASDAAGNVDAERIALKYQKKR